MKHLFFLAVLITTLLSCEGDLSQQNNSKQEVMNVNYPTTKKINHADTYFGDTLKDPYRWLEDDMANDTKEWVQQQNDVTFDFLNNISFRGKIRDRLEEVWNYEKLSAPFKRGDFTYYYKNNGLQNQFVLYRQKGEGEAEVFLDPNKFSEDGTTSLAGLSFTKSGKKAAYLISEGGSDWRKIIVIDVMNKNVIEDTLKDVKFSGVAWSGEDGFFYSSYDKPKDGSVLSGKTQHHKLFYHKLGTPQSEDQLLFGGEQTPRRYIFSYVTEDDRWLVITAANSTTGNELYIKDLSKPNAPITPLVSNYDNDHSVLHSEGEWLYIFTNLNAPKSKLVKVNVNNPGPENWEDVIPEKNEPLTINTGGGYLFAEYLKDALSLVEQYDLEGNLIRKVDLPGQGSIYGFGGRWEEESIYFTFTNHITPPTIYEFDVKSGDYITYKQPKVDFDPSLYVSKQVFYTSKDGTKVPMMITHKKDLEMNGNNPTLLYGYGGFNISLTPNFSTSNIIWLENGGVYAVPNLRGGGEYGEEWHKAGTKMNKQNVFDDFIAAAEYLIKENYTSSDYLAIMGGSNGGLLVGATMTQRPELFKVALPAVGVLDMLRYHTFTAGAGWSYDYGTVEDSKEMFDYLKGYSPYHNLKEGVQYPATLVTTGDHDDRVVPAHSFKFAARLQEAQGGTSPTLIRIETNAGHGAGKPTSKIIDEQADKWAFTFYNMNAPVKYIAN